MLLAMINSSIVLISLPAIFRGIGLNPLAPANIGYLLWMLMGYLVVTAVLVVFVGRLGDMFGRVRIYNAGFAVFTVAAIALSFDPFPLTGGAVWLIGWRVVQGVGGAILMALSAAILTDAFPSNQRGMALGFNMVAAVAGSFLGLLFGGCSRNGTGGRSSGSGCRSASWARCGACARCMSWACARRARWTGPAP
ncbi:major Facilitator Superfamily protein [Mycobacterium avium subsp. avium 2285 (R)]|nr:major Facilitator Superfamily protein [Mycobacterium avium subsp. avium 2285 (R)]